MPPRFKERYVTTLFAFTAALTGINAQAEQALTTTHLPAMEITVTRGEKQITGKEVITKTRDDINRLQAESTAETVAAEAGITVSGGPRSSNQRVNIRGLEGSRVLQTVDGVRQNFDSGHRPTYFLDPALLKQVEVMKGPVSSLWGSGAIGGVIAQQTIGAEDILSPDATFGGLAKQAFNSNTRGQKTLLAVGSRHGNMDILASAYYEEKDDLKLGNGNHLTDSAEDNHGGMLKGEWQIDDAQSLSFKLQASRSDGSIPANGAAAPGASNFVIHRASEDRQFSIRHRFNPQSEWLDSDITLFRTTTDIDESRVSDGRKDQTALRTTGFSLSNRSVISGNALLYGIDASKDDFQANRGGIARPNPPDAETRLYGAFFQASRDIHQDISTSISIRHDRFSTQASNLAQKRDNSENSASAAISWRAADWLKLSLRYDEAFRAPGSEEMYTTGTHFCFFPGFCNTFVANPNLDPEQAKNKELLLDMAWQNIYRDTDKLSISMNIFRNDVDDFIEQFVTNPVFPFNPGITSWRNVNKARIEGFEIQSHYSLENFNARLSYGQTRGKDRNTGNALAGIPADQWKADFSYDVIPEKLLAGLRFTHAATQDKTPPGGPTPHYSGYNITDFYTRWSPSAVKDLTIDFSINNLTDKHYRIAFQELYQPGREVRVSATYRF